MNKCVIEEIEKSLELPIGTRFYLQDTLFEVAEVDEGKVQVWGCSKCAFNEEDKEEICLVMRCDGSDGCRHDRKYICFKEVEETEGEPAQLQIQKKSVGNGAYRNANNSNNIESIKTDQLVLVGSLCPYPGVGRSFRDYNHYSYNT